MTNAELSTLAERAAAAAAAEGAGDKIQRAVREAVWDTGRSFVRPTIIEID